MSSGEERQLVELEGLIVPRPSQAGPDFRALVYAPENGALADPVLYLAHFVMTGPTFGPHPHAGFSAITYLFPDSQTGFRNRDSLGNDEVIAPGGLHWTCAVGGILHDEEPVAPGLPAHGLQIFLNLPRDRQLDPAAIYRIGPDQAQAFAAEGGSGRVLDARSAGIPQDFRLWDLQLDGAASLPVPPGWGGLVLALDGELRLPDPLASGAARRFAADGTGGELLLASAGPARAAVLAGAALAQPVHWHGPFALARAEEVEGRIAAYRTGAMGRLAPLG